jgi:Ca2+-dependent lipid-binding protein
MGKSQTQVSIQNHQTLTTAVAPNTNSVNNDSGNKKDAASSSMPPFMKHVTNRLIKSLLDEIDSDEMRKTLMDKLVSPSLKLVYNQIMPYLLIIMGLMVVILIIIMLTFCMMVFMCCGKLRIR